MLVPSLGRYRPAVLNEFVIYGCDIGSTRSGNFAWVRLLGDGTITIRRQGGATAIEELRDTIVEDILHENRISFGIEAPLLIPIPKFANDLSRRRVGEGNRSWSAPPGLAVAMIALHQM